MNMTGLQVCRLTERYIYPLGFFRVNKFIQEKLVYITVQATDVVSMMKEASINGRSNFPVWDITLRVLIKFHL